LNDDFAIAHVKSSVYIKGWQNASRGDCEVFYSAAVVTRWESSWRTISEYAANREEAHKKIAHMVLMAVLKDASLRRKTIDWRFFANQYLH
jgi:hypothetical protein